MVTGWDGDGGILKITHMPDALRTRPGGHGDGDGDAGLTHAPDALRTSPGGHGDGDGTTGFTQSPDALRTSPDGHGGGNGNPVFTQSPGTLRVSPLGHGGGGGGVGVLVTHWPAPSGDCPFGHRGCAGRPPPGRPPTGAAHVPYSVRTWPAGHTGTQKPEELRVSPNEHGVGEAHTPRGPFAGQMGTQPPYSVSS